MKKLKTFDSGYFRGKSHFEDDGTQNYLVFQPITGILKQLVLIIILIFYHGNLKDCLKKKSILSKQLTIYLIHT